MFLKQLKLENVRCFSELTLDFARSSNQNRKWTILLGENGTGKSTILRAIGLVTAGLDSLPEILDEPDYWIRNDADFCRIDATIETAEGEDRELSLVINRGEGISDILDQNRERLSPLTRALRHAKRSYFVAGYGTSRRLATERSLSKLTSGFRDERSQSIATLFDNDAVMNPLESWAMDLDYRESERGLQVVKEVLDHFLPGLSFSHIDKERGQLVFKTPDGPVPLQYLSDGYQNVAAWTGDLLHRITNVFEDYSKPLEARGLLIVDEVDLHLHPKWQKMLYNYLEKRLKNMQLVVTTHSAITVQQADAEEVHYLVREGKKINLNRIDIDPGKFQLNQLLMTDAFGLQSDESLRIEQKKQKYKKLRDEGAKTDKETSQLQSLAAELREYSQAQIETATTDADRRQGELLRRIQSELSSAKDDLS